MSQWSQQILEDFFAPGITQFTEAKIDDLGSKHPEADHWLSNHLLNSVFRGQFPRHGKAAVLNILYRARVAFKAYDRGRTITLGYLGQLQPFNPLSKSYFDALSCWEVVILNVQIAQDIITQIGSKLFEQDDGSDDDRLWKLAGAIKHAGSQIKRGEHTSEFTVPIWMTNEGLIGRKAHLTWAEVTAEVDGLAAFANTLQDPATAAEKVGSRAL